MIYLIMMLIIILTNEPNFGFDSVFEDLRFKKELEEAEKAKKSAPSSYSGNTIIKIISGFLKGLGNLFLWITKMLMYFAIAWGIWHFFSNTDFSSNFSSNQNPPKQIFKDVVLPSPDGTTILTMEANTTYFVKASMDRRYRLEEHFDPNFIGLIYPNGVTNGISSLYYPADEFIKKEVGNVKWRKPYEPIYIALICTDNDDSKLECEVLSDRTIAVKGKEGGKLKLSLNFQMNSDKIDRETYPEKYFRGGWLITVSSKN